MGIEYDHDPVEFYQNCFDRGRLPKTGALKQVVLERIVEQFQRGDTSPKQDVNEVSEQVFEDYVLVRRELVNFGYLEDDNAANTSELRRTELTEADYRTNTRLERHARDLDLLK